MPGNNTFELFEIGKGLMVRNRLAMAPMTTWASNDDLTISDEEDAYYRRRVGGVGFVITGCTHVTPNGIGFSHEFASTSDDDIPSLRKLADAAKSGGAPAILQIFHAGNKALPDWAPGGDVVSASAVPVPASGFAPAQTPRALSADEVLEIIRAFGETTRRAIEAGFDGVELHGAHGFLIQNFFSPAFNHRDDEWGGSLENRMRFGLSVVAEVKKTIAAYADRPFILGYRISPEEPGDHGYGIQESLRFIDSLIPAGIDYVHASLASILDSKPIADPDGLPIAQIIARHVAGRVPVLAAGSVRTPDQAKEGLALGLSAVAIGQGLVMNPNWVELARDGRETEIRTALDPSSMSELAIPAKLQAIIKLANGWFQIKSAITTE